MSLALHAFLGVLSISLEALLETSLNSPHNICDSGEILLIRSETSNVEKTV